MLTALAAADEHAVEGTDAEASDPKTFSHISEDPIPAFLRPTHRVVAAGKRKSRCPLARGIAALAADRAFDALPGSGHMITARQASMPSSRPLEDAEVSLRSTRRRWYGDRPAAEPGVVAPLVGSQPRPERLPTSPSGSCQPRTGPSCVVSSGRRPKPEGPIRGGAGGASP